MSDDFQPTDGQLIARYLELRAWVLARQEACDVECAVVKGHMKALNAEMHQRLLDRGGQSASTDTGTFFFETLTSVKVSDPQALHDWVFAHNLRQFVTAHVAKEPVLAYLEEHKVTPPGVTVDRFQQVKVRSK